MQNDLKLEVGKRFKTLCGLTAVITYRQPADVADSFPFVGHVISPAEENAPEEKFGFSWCDDGRCSDSEAYEIVEEEK